MGGFRFNGCGATDHFKKVKSLGTHRCPRCNQDTEFFLETAKFKVDVFFIPTVTLKSRYAVMCGRCEQGEFCSDQWAMGLLNSTAGQIRVIFESQTQEAVQIDAPAQEPSPGPEAVADVSFGQPEAAVSVSSGQPEAAAAVSSVQEAQRPVSRGSAVSTFFKCAHCGVTQLREGAFCSYCGKPAPEEPNAPPAGPGGNARDETIVCPVCGNRQKSGMKFCFNCGHQMEAQPSTERVCPGCGAKIEGAAAFCMECGVRL